MSTSRTREKADGELFKSTGIDDNATSTAVTIDASENVGIGTSSPSSWAKLNVAGTGGLQTGATQALHVSSPSATANEGVGIRLNAASGSHEAVGIIGMVNNSSGNYGSMTFHTYSGGSYITERMRVTSTGVAVTGGISLGGTGAANTISDYETGSWTPSIGGNATYTNQVGRYIKIGNMVWVNFAIGINAQGTGNTSSGISGLPFVSGLGSQNTSNLTWYGLGVAMIYGVYYVGAGQSALSLSYTSGAATQLTNNPNSLVNGAQMQGSFAYTV